MTVFQNGCINLHSQPCWEYSLCSVSSQIFDTVRLNFIHSGRCVVISHCDFKCISLVISLIENLSSFFFFLFSYLVFPLLKSLIKSPPFSHWVACLFHWSIRGLWIINHSSVICVAHIVSHHHSWNCTNISLLWLALPLTV